MKQHSNSAALPGTQAVLRAITVLKTLGRSTDAFGITELGSATGLSKATVFRLLGALESEGLVARDATSGAYRLGPELITLGATALSSADLRSIAHDELLRLTRESGETATLEVLLAGQVLIVDEVQGRFLLGSTPEIGRRWPAHATSTGKVLLALSHPTPMMPKLSKLAPRTITSREAFARELARVRRNGFASAVEELEPGLAALAAPIWNHAGLAVASISVNGPVVRLHPKRRRTLLAQVCSAAQRVSRRLGASKLMVDTLHQAVETSRRRRA